VKRPREVIPTLSLVMKTALKLGIGGATQSTLDALSRRGLAEDAPEKPGYVKLSELGHIVALVLKGKGCEACGKSYMTDPITLDDIPTCDCEGCQKCGTRYELDEEDTPSLAPSDKIAKKHDPSDLGMCGPCWRRRGV
jgi:hypothetical protein